MRMQIAFRETDTTRNGYSVAIAGGIVETDPDDRLSYDECMVPFFISFTDGLPGVAICGRRPARIADDDLGTLLAVDDLESLLTAKIARETPSPAVNAEFAMRETAVEPSVPGGTVYAFSGLVYLAAGQSVDFRRASQLESLRHLDGRTSGMAYGGIIGDTVRPELGPLDVVEEMDGEAMSGLLRKPWWAFGAEPVALPGTMRRDVYERAERFQDLHFADRTQAEETEYATLLEQLKPAGMTNILNDRAFERFVAATREAPGYVSSYRPTPLSAFKSREDHLRTLVAALVERDRKLPGL